MATLADIGTGGVFFWTGDGGSTIDARENSSANAHQILDLIQDIVYFDAQGNYTGNYEFWVAPNNSWNDQRQFDSYATLTGLSSAEEITTILEPRHDVRTEQISGGALSWTRSNALTFVRVQTESLDPTDDLDTLTVTNVEDGDIVVLVPDDASNVVTVTEQDNIDVLEGNTFSMSDAGKAIWLYWDGSDWKEFNRNRGIEDTETRNLGTGGGTIDLDPATDSDYQIVKGSGTLTGSYTIQLDPSKTPADGHRFIVDYRAGFTANGNGFTIFGKSLTDEQISSGETIVIATYDANASTYQARLLQDFDATDFIESSMVKDLDGAKLQSSSVPNSALAGGPFQAELDNYKENPNNPSSNTVSGDNAVAVGEGNTVSGADAFAAGDSNTASGAKSTALGDSNTASGEDSVAEGVNNEASSEKSHATGGRAVADRHGVQTHSSGTLGTRDGDAQSSKAIYKKITTDSTKTEAFLDNGSGPARLTLPTDSSFAFFGRAIATQTGGGSGSVGDLFHFEFKGTISNVGGTTSLASSVSVTTVDSVGGSGWTIDVTADNTNDALKIEVTGENNKTIQWVVTVWFSETRW